MQSDSQKCLSGRSFHLPTAQNEYGIVLATLPTCLVASLTRTIETHEKQIRAKQKEQAQEVAEVERRFAERTSAEHTKLRQKYENELKEAIKIERHQLASVQQKLSKDLGESVSLLLLLQLVY